MEILSMQLKISYHVKPGQSVGIVGESGSGKSVSAMAIMGLLPSSIKTSGDILFRDTLLSSLSEKEYRHIRGKKMVTFFKTRWLH